MPRKILLVLNDPPYGTERSYNALRLAQSVSKREDVEVRVFLLGDAAGCALAGHNTPDGYYKLDRMLRAVTNRGARAGVCGTCLDARGLGEATLVKGAHRSTIDELTDWTLWADSVMVF